MPPVVKRSHMPNVQRTSLGAMHINGINRRGETLANGLPVYRGNTKGQQDTHLASRHNTSSGQSLEHEDVDVAVSPMDVGDQLPTLLA